MNGKAIAIVMASAGAVAATGLAIYIWRRRKAESLDEGDVAYTYEEAREKLQKLAAEGKMDDVRVVTGASTVGKDGGITAYHKVGETPAKPEAKEAPGPVKDLDWPDERDGEWYRISEDAFEYGNDGADKELLTWREGEPYFKGVDGEIIANDELLARSATLLRDGEESPWYFVTNDGTSKAEVVIEQG